MAAEAPVMKASRTGGPRDPRSTPVRSSEGLVRAHGTDTGVETPPPLPSLNAHAHAARL